METSCVRWQVEIKPLLSLCYSNKILTGVAFCGVEYRDIAVTAYDMDEIYIRRSAVANWDGKEPWIELQSSCLDCGTSFEVPLGQERWTQEHKKEMIRETFRSRAWIRSELCLHLMTVWEQLFITISKTMDVWTVNVQRIWWAHRVLELRKNNISNINDRQIHLQHSIVRSRSHIVAW